MRSLAIALVLATAACASAPVAPPPVRAPAPAPPAATPSATTSASTVPAPAPTRSPSTTAQARETRLIARMLARVEEARGLASTRPVPGVVLDRAALIAQVKAHVSKELPPEAIRDEGLELGLFGFLPADFDYEAAEYDLLQDQLAGYYEPADGTMYMASDLGEEEAGATLAHELVHALQDQRWNLEERSKYRPGDGDRSEALSALAEGDATSAMFDVMIERARPGSGKSAVDLPDELFAEQIRAGMDQGESAKAPHVMRTSLVAPYVYGTLFVHALRRRGGWDAVDHAWDDPPATTEQILHVDKWLAHEPAIAVKAPPFATLGPGWKASDEDSEGELGVRLAIEEWSDPKTAADLAAGWGGDRDVLVTKGDEAALAWRLRYDPGKTPGERAARVWRGLGRALDNALGPAKVADARFVCRERADRGPFAIARAGADIVWVLGPAHAGKGAWSSAGDCARARAWTREIAAAP